MRELTYLVATTLDGFIAGPGGEHDFFSTSGDHIDGLIEHYPESLPGGFRDHLGITAIREFDTVLEGRATHQIGLDAGVADAYPHLRHIVFSRTLVSDAVTVVDSDPLEYVRALKREQGHGIWLCGGGAIAGALLPEIDRLVLKVYPVLIGSGIRVLDAPFAPRSFELESTRRFASGVSWQSYRRSS
ncbi:MAG: dihydrofolate reductase family protein [Rhodoglobus sp.]|nr:dihydrofolate reductase family protein [Rhodoglobus sp.]